MGIFAGESSEIRLWLLWAEWRWAGKLGWGWEFGWRRWRIERLLRRGVGLWLGLGGRWRRWLLILRLLGGVLGLRWRLSRWHVSERLGRFGYAAKARWGWLWGLILRLWLDRLR